MYSLSNRVGAEGGECDFRFKERFEEGSFRESILEVIKETLAFEAD